MTSKSSYDGRLPLSLAVGLIIPQLLPAPSPLAAELFSLPPPNQERQQRSFAPTQLSQQDREKIAQLAEKSKQLSPSDQQQFRNDIRNSRTNAIRNGQLNEAQFYDELLQKLD